MIDILQLWLWWDEFSKYVYLHLHTVKNAEHFKKYTLGSFLWWIPDSWLHQNEDDYFLPSYQQSELIEVDKECELCTFYERHVAKEIAADTLGEECKVVWSKFVAGMKTFSHEARFFDSFHCACDWTRDISCYRLRRTGVKSTKPLQGYIYWRQSECSQIGYYLRKEKRTFLEWQLLLYFGGCGPLE